MKKKIIALSLTLIILTGLGLLVLPAQAQVRSIINPADTKYAAGTYGLDDFIILAITVSRWILGIVGSLSLVMFIYGGFMFLISAGASEKVEKAKQIILAAVIGLIIVFASFLIIQFALGALGISWTGQVEKPELLYNQSNAPAVDVQNNFNTDNSACNQLQEWNLCVNNCNREYTQCQDTLPCSPVFPECQFYIDICNNNRTNCLNGCGAQPSGC